MVDRLVSEIDPAELAKAVVTALRDADADSGYIAHQVEGEVTIDISHMPLAALGSHLKRILLLDPPSPAA